MKYALKELMKDIDYKENTLTAVKSWKIMNPQTPKGNNTTNIKKRFDKFDWILDWLNKIYETDVGLVGENLGNGSSENSYYNKRNNEIVLRGKLSIITFFHMYAKAKYGRGKELSESDEKQACQWSINLYRYMYPEKARDLMQDTHGLIRVIKSFKKKAKKKKGRR